MVCQTDSTPTHVNGWKHIKACYDRQNGTSTTPLLRYKQFEQKQRALAREAQAASLKAARDASVKASSTRAGG